MPVRRSHVAALDVIAYSGTEVMLDLRVGSGTYVRSLAAALGGHCRTLQRTEIGPFSLDEATGDLQTVELIEPAAALRRLPAEAVTRAPKDALVRAGLA